MAANDEAVVSAVTEQLHEWPKSQPRRAVRMTAALYPFERLGSPITVNRLAIRNRIVMGPMGNLGMADANGQPTAKMIVYFAERARGGAGLLTSGLVPVLPSVDPSVEYSGAFPRLCHTHHAMGGWRDLASAVHAHGAGFFVQLTAGLGRVGSPECLSKGWRLPVSASWNRNYYVRQVPCRPLTDRECRRIVSDMGQAAADAQECGIDGVYLHGHEGYLLEQFANPAFNHRRFGRYADWQSFGRECVTEIRRRCGPDYPIMYRIDLSLALRATFGDRMNSEPVLRRFSNERSVTMSLEYIRTLIGAGVDLLDADLGCYENWWLPHPPSGTPPAPYLPLARVVKDYLIGNGIKSNAGQQVPVVAVGKLGYPDVAEAALRDGSCDMVMLARPLLADPEWPRKVFAGRVQEIVPCIGDHDGCLSEIVRGGHIQCAVNPRAGFEEQAQAQPAGTRRRVAVVGAGPAGIVCACLAAARGHAVVLFEQHQQVGGWLRAGSVPVIKFDVANYLVHLEHRLEQATEQHGLELQLGRQAQSSDLAAGDFDAVVCCTGSHPERPEFAKGTGGSVVFATDLLLNPSLAADKHGIAVIGGGELGCETAHMLACEYGKRVTVIEADPHFMAKACTANRGLLLHQLERLGVSLLNCTRVAGISEGAVEVVRNVAASVPSPKAVWSPVLPGNVVNPLARRIAVVERQVTIAADLIVLATGQVPSDSLYRACIREGLQAEIHNVGDAFRVGRIFDATRAAYAVGAAL